MTMNRAVTLSEMIEELNVRDEGITQLESQIEEIKKKLTSPVPSPTPLRYAWSVKEAAKLIGVSYSMLYQMQKEGRGPKFTHIDGRTVILDSNLKTWLESL